MSEKNWKLLKSILVLGTVLATIKLIFVDYTLDEEYQIVMAYRNLKGDQLFKQMWEPHQTSAFMCSAFMWLYMMITGTTTGVILFLRIVTTGIHAGLSYALYRTIVKKIDKEYAILLALLFFNISPKNIQIPEFSNMQLWFLVIPVLALLKYYEDREAKKWYLLVVAGIALSCEILTYPTCIILFPFFLIYILRKSEKSKWRDCFILTGTCGVCACLWLWMILRHVSVREFLLNLQNLLSFDPTHAVSGMTDVKSQTYISNLVLWSIWCVIIGIVSVGITYAIKVVLEKKERTFDKEAKTVVFWVIAILLAELVQAYYWIVCSIGYEYLQIHFLVILLAVPALWKKAGEERKVFFWGIIATLVAYVGVMYISDLTLYNTLPHGAMGIIFGLAVIVSAMQNVMKEKAKPWILLLVISLCFCSIGARGYTLRGGKSDNTIWSVAGVMKDGPAWGIFADYMCAYIYNCNYEDYGQYVEEGDNVLIVANMVMAPGTTAYMFEDVNISHFSIVDPTTYDERLLTYWEQYPEKEPNVIVVDCWYGELKENPGSWIMQYIENEFDYTSVSDGRYVRFYRR